MRQANRVMRLLSLHAFPAVRVGPEERRRERAEGVAHRKGTRNTPSLLNAAFQSHQTWDGRRNSLGQQVLAPFLSPTEHGLTDIEELLRRIRNSRDYLGAYAAAFSDTVQPIDAANTEVVRAQLKSIGTLGGADTIDDILITLSTQYDIVRPLAANPAIFLYLAMDKDKSNLAMARYRVAECEGQLEL